MSCPSSTIASTGTAIGRLPKPSPPRSRPRPGSDRFCRERRDEPGREYPGSRRDGEPLYREDRRREPAAGIAWQQIPPSSCQAEAACLPVSCFARAPRRRRRAYRRRTGGGATPWRSDPCEPWKAQRFPVSARIFVGHLDGRDPFRVLVAELDRRAQTHRISKRIGERVAAVLECQQRLRMQRRRHVDTTRVIVCGPEGDVFGPEIRADTFEEEAQRDAGPTADITPALDADMLDDHRG